MLRKVIIAHLWQLQMTKSLQPFAISIAIDDDMLGSCPDSTILYCSQWLNNRFLSPYAMSYIRSVNDQKVADNLLKNLKFLHHHCEYTH
jgi:hypothetical protein